MTMVLSRRLRAFQALVDLTSPRRGTTSHRYRGKVDKKQFRPRKQRYSLIGRILARLTGRRG